MQQEQYDVTVYPTEPSHEVSFASGLLGCCCYLFILAIAIVMIVAMWKVFVKAGKPGWASIVPIYNGYVLTEIVGRPILWFILLIVPCTFPIAHIVLSLDLAKSFGKDTLFGVGLILFPYIFYPLLGFGDAKYQPVQQGP